MQNLPSKKLAIVVNDAAFFLSHRRNIAETARAAGMHVTVCTPPDASVGEITALGFSHRPIRLSRWGAHPLREAAALYSLFCLYRDLRPDIVHHVTIKPVIYGSIAARTAGVPAIVNAISGLGQVFTSRGLAAALRRTAVKFLYRTALAGSNVRVIFQNKDDQACFLESRLIAESKAVLIRGAGVDLSKIAAPPEAAGTIIVLFASRLLREKGIEDFVAAATALKARGIRARFVVAGLPVPGNPGSVSLEELETWKNGGIVDCVGFQANMQELIQNSHIVCLPSYYGEGIPKILIEASAGGRAIVTTDWPGCRDIVVHEYNGLLVKPRDCDALAAAIEKLILDGELRREFGTNGRARVEQEGFDEATVVRQTLEVYQSLLDGGAKLPLAPSKEYP